MTNPQIVPIKPQPSTPWLVRHWRKIRETLVWSGFFLVLYFLENFLSLIFITFILAYTLESLVKFLCGKIPWPRWGIILLVYFVLVIILTGFGMVVIPKVYNEGKSFSKGIPEAKTKLITSAKELLGDENFSTFIKGIGIEEELPEKFASLFQAISEFLQNLFRTSFHFILSVVFSFLILWDLERLKREVSSLSETRFKRILQTLSPKLIEFGDILGRAFEAQIIIACLNTLLTLVGLTFLGIPSKFFLSVFVFLCSFIPVLGVIISSIPICLLAYKTDGFVLAFYSGILILIIHFIEAYFLNPRIVGAHLALHPFVAVCILVFSEYFFGVWGLLLGVPMSVFLYKTLFILPAKPLKPLEPLEKDKNFPAPA